MRIEGTSRLPVNLRQEATTEPDIKSRQDWPDEGDQTEATRHSQGKTSEADVMKAIEAANDSFEVYNRSLRFSIHEQTKQIMVRVVDTKTEEVIREIPPEKILDMVAKLWELAGLFVDERI